jgi:hypothetical protein
MLAASVEDFAVGPCYVTLNTEQPALLADEPSFLETWQDDAEFMKRQPGFISTQLHRAVGDSLT